MQIIKNSLKKEIIIVGESLYGDSIFSFYDAVEISHPPEHFSSDYACSIPLRLAKKTSKPPAEIASSFIEELKKIPYINKHFDDVYEKNGFLNFVLNNQAILKFGNILARKGSQAFLKGSKKKNKKILNEFISANPTGPLTMGNARGAFLGDVLTKIFLKVGYAVHNEYYVNNAKNSKQIQELGKTFLGKSDSYLTPWLSELILTLKKSEKVGRILMKLAGNQKEAGAILANKIQEYNKNFIVKKLHIHFDNWFEENELYKGEDKADAAINISNTLKLLEKSELVYEEGGAIWFKTVKYGDDEDRVLVRSSGEATYFLADIAYHLNKYDRGYDELINIWGADHQGHVKRLYAAMKALDKDENKLNIIITQLVRLVENGETAKMSKRAGMYVTLEELVDEVGIDVARFFFLMRAPETHIDFDLVLAKEKSNKNPVYYVQYAYVRASNILRRAGMRRFFANNFSLSANFSDEERELLVKLLQFPELVFEISDSYQAHRLTTYAQELSRSFHNFYEAGSVLGEKNAQIRKNKLALCRVTQIVLKELLELMGISTPKRM